MQRPNIVRYPPQLSRTGSSAVGTLFFPVELASTTRNPMRFVLIDSTATGKYLLDVARVTSASAMPPGAFDPAPQSDASP